MKKIVKRGFNRAPIIYGGYAVEFSGTYTSWVGKTYPRSVRVASSVEEVKKTLGGVTFPKVLNIRGDSSEYFGWVHWTYWLTDRPDVGPVDETVMVSSYNEILKALEGLENVPYRQYGDTEKYESLRGLVKDPFTGKKIGEVVFEYDLSDIDYPPRVVNEGGIDPDEAIKGLIKAGHIKETEVI